jgi:hypothetical protein
MKIDELQIKKARGKVLLQLETNDGTLTIPLTELCKTETSNGKITIHGKSYDSED